MHNYKLVSKTDGAIAAISILFLPVVGCGNDSLTGIEVLQSNDAASNIKALLLFAILAGIALLFTWQTVAAITVSIFGLVSLYTSFYLAHIKMESLEMRVDAYLATVGFVATAVINVLKQSTGDKKT